MNLSSFQPIERLRQIEQRREELIQKHNNLDKYSQATKIHRELGRLGEESNILRRAFPKADKQVKRADTSKMKRLIYPNVYNSGKKY